MRKLQRVPETSYALYKDIDFIYEREKKVARRSYGCLLVNDENMHYPDKAKMYYAHSAYKPFDGWMGCTWCPKDIRKQCIRDYQPPIKHLRRS